MIKTAREKIRGIFLHLYSIICDLILRIITSRQVCGIDKTVEDMDSSSLVSAVELIGSNKMFGGLNRRYKHFSSTLGCSMTFSVYFPPTTTPAPVSNIAKIFYFLFLF